MIMNASDHPLYLSSPDSTCSQSSSSSIASHRPQSSSSRSKSFLISDILKPTFGHPHEKYSISKCNIPLSPTTTNDSSSSSNKTCTANTLPAWVFCTRYSDRPSAGRKRERSEERLELLLSRPSRTKTEAMRYTRLETATNGLHHRSVGTFERWIRSEQIPHWWTSTGSGRWVRPQRISNQDLVSE